MNDDLNGLLTDPVLYHTHHAYYRTRCRRVKDMKVVVVVRSILESLESAFLQDYQQPRVAGSHTGRRGQFLLGPLPR